MEIFETLDIIVTKEFVEGRRINGKIPVVLSETHTYTPHDLEKFDGECEYNKIILNNDEILVVSLDLSCSIIISGFRNNPTGVVLHGDETDLIKLLSGLNGQLCFENVRLQRVDHASKRAVLNIYREVFKSVERFIVEDKNGQSHIVSMIMDLDKLSYSSDTGVNMDEFVRLLHSDIEVVKVDHISKIVSEGLSVFEAAGLEFCLVGANGMTRGKLKSRRTYEVRHNGMAIGSVVIFGRCHQKQIYIDFTVDKIFDESEISQFEKALQRYTMPNLNDWVIILNYVGNKKMVEVVMGDVDVEESPVAVDEVATTEATSPEVARLVLKDADKPFYYNFTDIEIVSGDIEVVGYDGESLHERLLMGAIVDFKSPVAAIRIIGDLLMAGIDRIYYLNGETLEKYNVEGHVDSAETLIDNFRGRRRAGRDYGDLSHRSRR